MADCRTKYIPEQHYNTVRMKVFNHLRSGFDYENWLDQDSGFSPEDVEDLKIAIKKLIGDTDESRARAMNIILGKELGIEGAFGPRFQVGQAKQSNTPATIVVESTPLSEKRTEQLGIKGAFLTETTLNNPIAAYGNMVSEFRKRLVESILYDPNEKTLLNPDYVIDPLSKMDLLNKRLFDYKVELMNKLYEKLHGVNNYFSEFSTDAEFTQAINTLLAEYQNKKQAIDPDGSLFATYMILKNFNDLVETEFKNVIRVKRKYKDSVESGPNMYEYMGGKVEYDSSWGDEYADASDYSGAVVKQLLEYFHGRTLVKNPDGTSEWKDTDKSIGFATFSNLMTRVKEWADVFPYGNPRATRIKNTLHGDINSDWSWLIEEFIKDNKLELTTDEIAALRGIQQHLMSSPKLKRIFINQAKKTVRYRYLTVKPKYNSATRKIEMTTTELTDRLVDIQNFRFQGNIKNAVFRFKSDPVQYNNMLSHLKINVQKDKIILSDLLVNGDDFVINVKLDQKGRNKYQFEVGTSGKPDLDPSKVTNLIRTVLGVPIPSDVNEYVKTMHVPDLFSIFIKPLALTLYASSDFVKMNSDKSSPIYFDNDILVTFPYTTDCDLGARLMSKIYGTTDTNVIRNEDGNALPSYQITSSVYEVKEFIHSLQTQSKLRGGLHDGSARRNNTFAQDILVRRHRNAKKTPIGNIYTRGDVKRNDSTKSSNQLTSKEVYHLELVENFLKRLRDGKSIILQPITYSDKKTHFLIEYNIDSIVTLAGDNLSDVIHSLISTSESDRIVAQMKMLDEIRQNRGTFVKNQLIDIMSRYQRAFSLNNDSNWIPVSGNITTDALKHNIDYLRKLLSGITSKKQLREIFKDVDLNESLDFSEYKTVDGNKSYDLNTTLLHEAEMYLFDKNSFNRYWAGQKVQLAKSLNHVKYKFDAFFDGSLTSELNSWADALGDGWVDETGRTMKAYRAFDEAGNEISDLNNAFRVELHPIIEAYMLSDGLLSHSFNNLLFGATNGFSDKYKGTPLAVEEARHRQRIQDIMNSNTPDQLKQAQLARENETHQKTKDEIYIKSTAARLGDEFKRTVIGGAIRTPYAQGLKYGVSDTWLVSVVDDAQGYSYNYLGENAGNDANDGSGTASPYVAMQENESLGDGAVGAIKKSIINYTDPATGTMYEIKWAEFPDYNANRRGSRDVERRYQKMHSIKRITANDMIGFNISDYYDLNDVHFDSDDDRRRISHNDAVYYKDSLTGMHYKIESVSSRVENGQVYVDVVKRECDKNGKEGRLLNPESIAINYITDLDKVFGGKNCEKLDESSNKLVWSDANLEIVNNIICNQNLKKHMISFVVNKSAMKVGPTNVNNVDIFSAGNTNQLKYFEIGTTHAGVQMNADHEIDEASVSEMTQMISALIQNGFAKTIVDRVYDMIGRIAIKNISKFTDVLNDVDNPNYDKNIYLKVGKLFVESFIGGNKDSIGIAEAFVINAAKALQYNNTTSKVPFSSNQIKGIFQATITSTLNNLGIRRKFPGFGGINTPSYGQMQLFKIVDKNGNLSYGFMDELQDSIRNDLVAKQREGLIDIHWNAENVFDDQMSDPSTGIIDNPYIHQVTDPFTIEMEDTVIIRQKGMLGAGKPIAVRDLKTLDFVRHLGLQDDYDLFVWDCQPRELRQAQDTIQTTINGNNVTINWSDLDWTRASFYLNDNEIVPDGIEISDESKLFAAVKRNETISAALAGSGINWITGQISADVRKKLSSWNDNWTIEQKRSALVPLALRWCQYQIQDFAKKLSTSGTMNIVAPASLDGLLNPEVNYDGTARRATITIGNYNKASGQIIMGRANAKALGLRPGDSIADIRYQKSGFFEQRLLNKYSMPKRSEIDPRLYDAVIFDKEGNKTCIILGTVNSKLDRLYGCVPNRDYKINSDGMYEYDDQELFNADGKSFYKSKDGYDILVVEDAAAFNDVLKSKAYSHIRYNYHPSNWKDLLKVISPNSFSGDVAVSNVRIGNRVFTAAEINNSNLASELFVLEDGQNTRRLEKLAQKQYYAFEAQLNYILTRIPSQSMQSFMDVKVETWTDSMLNEVYVPRQLTWMQGSDYDIDKDYMMGFGLLPDGTLPTLSDLEEDYDPYEVLLLSAPTNRRTFTASVATGARNTLKSSDVEQILNGKVSLLNPILTGKTTVVNFDSSVKESDRNKVISILNKHENSKRSGKIETIALQNTVVRAILQVLRDPATQINMGKPISTKTLEKIAGNSTLAKDEQVMTLDNSFTKFMMQEQNMVGREVIGIGAVSLKHFFAASTFMNKQLSAIESILERPIETSKIVPIIMDIVYNAKLGENDITTLANLNFSKILALINRTPSLANITFNRADGKTIEEVFKNNANSHLFEGTDFVEGNVLHLKNLITYLDAKSNGTWDSPIDAASALSELISAATDNAKLLILSKINASTKFADIYTYLLGIGKSFREISDIMMSPIFNVVASYAQTDLYDSTRRTGSLENALQFVLNRRTLDGIDNNKFVWLLTNVNDDDHSGSEYGVSWVNRLFYKLDKKGNPIYQNSIGQIEEQPNNFVRRWYESRHPDEAPGSISSADLITVIRNLYYNRREKGSYNYTEEFQSFLNACYNELNNPESLAILLNMLNDRMSSGGDEYEPDPDAIVWDELDYLENSYDPEDSEEGVSDNLSDFDYKTLDAHNARVFYKYITEYLIPKNQAISEMQEDIPKLESLLDEIIPGTQEQQLHGQILGVNQGLKTDDFGEQNWIRKIENFVNQRYLKSGLEKAEEFNFINFLSDEKYRQKQIDLYESVKSNINILKSITNVNHFWSMLQIAGVNRSLIERSAAIKIERDLVDKVLRESKYTTKGISNSFFYKFNAKEFKELQRLVSDSLLLSWVSSLRGISIIVPKGERYYKGTTNSTAMTDIELGLNDNIDAVTWLATFKNLMDNYIIPRLIERNPDNEFFRNITTGFRKDSNTGKPYGFWKPSLDLSEVSKSPKLAVLYEPIARDFNKIVNDKIPSDLGIGDWTYGNLFYLYNILVHRDSLGGDSFTKLFEELTTARNRSSLVYSYNEFLAELDNGEYKWDEPIRVNSSGKESPFGTIVKYGPVSIDLRDVRYRCTIAETSEKKFKVRRRLTEDERYVNSFSLLTTDNQEDPNGKLDLTKQKRSDFILNLPFISRNNHNLYKDAISITRNETVKFDSGSTEILRAIIDNVQELAGVNVPIEVIDSDILTRIKNGEIKSDFKVEDAMLEEPAFMINGRIYINTDHVKLDSPVHEFMHIICAALKYGNDSQRALYYSLLKSVQRDSEEWNKRISDWGEFYDKAKKRYSQFVSGSDLQEEILIRALSQTFAMNFKDEWDERRVSTSQIEKVTRDIMQSLFKIDNPGERQISDIVNAPLREILAIFNSQFAGVNKFRVTNTFVPTNQKLARLKKKYVDNKKLTIEGDC